MTVADDDSVAARVRAGAPSDAESRQPPRPERSACLRARGAPDRRTPGSPAELVVAAAYDRVRGRRRPRLFRVQHPLFAPLSAGRIRMDVIAAPLLRGRRYGGRPIYFSDVSSAPAAHGSGWPSSTGDGGRSTSRTAIPASSSPCMHSLTGRGLASSGRQSRPASMTMRSSSSSTAAPTGPRSTRKCSILPSAATRGFDASSASSMSWGRRRSNPSSHRPAG